jgi:photosystem II stability/assembly factor-like uncharacterized protein
VRNNVNLRATKITSLLPDPLSSGILYASVYGGGVYKSGNYGTTWNIINEGLQDHWVHVLTMSPDNPQVLYAGTAGSGLFKSLDGGLTWSDRNVGLPSGTLSRMNLASPLNHFPSEGGVDEDLWSNFPIDSHSTESPSASTTSLAVRSIAIDPNAASTVYMGSLENGVYKSENGGESWSSSGLAGKSVYCLTMDPLDTAKIYAGVLGEDGSLWASSNSGASWEARNSGLSGRNVYALVYKPNSLVLAGTNDGLFMSSDGGNYWSSAGFSGLKVYALAVDPDSPDTIFLGASDGFYFSTDGGTTWQKENSGLVNTVVQSIALDPQSSKTYLGTDGSGAYRWNSRIP